MTLAAAIENGSQISKLRRENPIEVVLVLTDEIRRLCNFFNTKRGIDEDMFVELAEMIMEEFWYLKIEEIQYCFKQAKLGKYETRVLDRLDGSIVILWLREYDQGEKIGFSEKKAKGYKQLESAKTAPLEIVDYEKYKKRSLGEREEEKAAESTDREYQLFRMQYLLAQEKEKREIQEEMGNAKKQRIATKKQKVK